MIIITAELLMCSLERSLIILRQFFFGFCYLRLTGTTPLISGSLPQRRTLGPAVTVESTSCSCGSGSAGRWCRIDQLCRATTAGAPEVLRHTHPARLPVPMPRRSAPSVISQPLPSPLVLRSSLILSTNCVCELYVKCVSTVSAVLK